MKKYKRIFSAFYSVIFIVTAFVLALISYYSVSLNSGYKVIEGKPLEFASEKFVVASFNTTNVSAQKMGVKTNYTVDLKLFGIFPIKSTNVQVVDNNYVEVLGTPFGIKIYTEGVMVVGVSEVSTEGKSVSPSKDAGIVVGDTIISIDSVNVYSNNQVMNIISDSSGKTLNFKILRNGQTLNLKVTPVLSAQTGTYRAGLWVRDSSAGIGTLTFYSPNEQVICGLGHAICDVDTGEMLKLHSGELVSAKIISVNKGQSGAPGELVGQFNPQLISTLNANEQSGVYGICNLSLNACKNLMPIALKQEIVNGDAQILTTVDSNEPKLYSCKISISNSSAKSVQNLIVTVTDDELLKTTGGIVQGMSGSPIIQNGKLVGAVTHVLVDDPTKGYGIFAENMLETAQSVANEELKEAS